MRMTGTEGALALELDFGEVPPAPAGMAAGRGRSALRIAYITRDLPGSEKYQVLEHRRRRAQIAARHLLELLDGER